MPYLGLCSHCKKAVEVPELDWISFRCPDCGHTTRRSDGDQSAQPKRWPDPPLVGSPRGGSEFAQAVETLGCSAGAIVLAGAGLCLAAALAVAFFDPSSSGLAIVLAIAARMIQASAPAK